MPDFSLFTQEDGQWVEQARDDMCVKLCERLDDGTEVRVWEGQVDDLGVMIQSLNAQPESTARVLEELRNAVQLAGVEEFIE